MSDRLFEETARDFASSLDQAMAGGAWRGELFLAALRRAVTPGSRVLDYGCGPGRLALHFARAGFAVEAIDPSPAMIEQARRLDKVGLALEFSVGGEAQLGERRFDAVVCSSVIEYVPDALGLLRCFHRALAPGGALLLSYPNRRSLWRRWSRWRRPDAPHLRISHHAWSSAEAGALVASAGFRVDGPPRFFEAAPFDRRPPLDRLSRSQWIGTLALVVAWG